MICIDGFGDGFVKRIHVQLKIFLSAYFGARSIAYFVSPLGFGFLVTSASFQTILCNGVERGE
jgi:hypothetical protein